MEIEGYYPQTSYSLGPRIVFQPWSKWNSYELARGNSTRLITPNTSQLCSKHWKKLHWKQVLFFVLSRNWFWLNLDSNDLVTWSLKNFYMPVLRILKLARHLEACKALGSPFAILWERNLLWKAGYRSRGFRFCLLIIVNPIKELPRPAFTGAVSSRDIRGEPWGGHCQLVQEQKSGG